jgi:Mn-dependent DtxR family transcriptional regulator
MKQKDEKIRQDILEFLRAHPNEEFLTKDIAKNIGAKFASFVLVLLEELEEKGLVEKRYFGQYWWRYKNNKREEDEEVMKCG